MANNHAASHAASGGDPLTGGMIGTTTDDSAAVGQVGEYVSSSIASASAVALTNNTAADITSISLTAGDWDVWANAAFKGGATTSATYLQSSISNTTATMDATNGRYAEFSGGGTGVALFASGQTVTFTNGPVRISIAATTTIYMVALAGFSVSTCSGYGIIQARRRR